MSREAMKLALEALEYIEHNYMSLPAPAEKAITALREALAEQPAQTATYTCGVCGVSMQMEQPAQQEPVARQYQGRDGVWKDFISEKHYKATLEDGSWPIRNLYTSPQSKPWVGLTLEEIDTEWGLFMSGQGSGYIPDFVHAIEAKLKEKNI